VAGGRNLARGKNRGKRIGENKGVWRFSLFYSSPRAGYAPRDVRRKININKKSAKISVSLEKF
jgi:hypothetical protein